MTHRLDTAHVTRCIYLTHTTHRQARRTLKSLALLCDHTVPWVNYSDQLFNQQINYSNPHACVTKGVMPQIHTRATACGIMICTIFTMQTKLVYTTDCHQHGQTAYLTLRGKPFWVY